MLGMKSSLIAALCLLLFAAAPAWAGDPIPGIDIGLGQSPGGLTFTGKSGAEGTVNFPNLPAATYEVYIPYGQRLPSAIVVGVKVGNGEIVWSDPIDTTAPATRSKRGYAVSKGGDALAYIVPRTTRSSPPNANTIQVVVTTAPVQPPPRAPR